MADDEVKRNAEFLMAEYKESAKAYFQGTNIGWTGLRFFITINATFGAAFAVLSGLKDQTVAVGHIVKFSPYISLGIVAVAIILCLAVILVQKHYFDHLENCRSRCEQLEAVWDGKLFTRLGKIGTDGRFHSAHVVNLIVFLIITLWAAVAYFSFFA